jgi:hypothetical protein
MRCRRRMMSKSSRDSAVALAGFVGVPALARRSTSAVNRGVAAA